MHPHFVNALHHYLDTSALHYSDIDRIFDTVYVDWQPATDSGRACCHTTTAAEPTAELPSRLIGKVQLNVENPFQIDPLK